MILVTGANGLVGSFVVRNLLAKNQDVRVLCRPGADLSLLKDVLPKLTVVSGDIMDVPTLEDAIEGCEFVIHAAAVVSFNPKEKEKLLRVNVEGTANVVNVCLSKNIKKLVFVSSVAALGRPSNIKNKSVTITENQTWEDSPLNSTYAKSKYLAELEVWRGIAEGLPAVVVCPALVLGEGDWHRTSTEVYRYVYEEKSFYPLGKVNAVDVLVVAEAVVRLLLENIENERFILSSECISYRVFFESIAEHLGKRPPNIAVTPWLGAIAWRWEALKAIFAGKAPLVTRETVSSSQLSIIYDNQKIQKSLPGFVFQPIEKTHERICHFLREKYEF